MLTLPDDPIFISYSRRDTESMQKIVVFLRDQGFKVWVDNERLIPGTPIWEEEIEKAIKAASTVVVVMSPDSKNSEWVRREISLADQYRKYILPILVRGDEDSSITLRLVTRQFVDLRMNEMIGLTSLRNALVEHLGETHERSDNKSNSPISHNIDASSNTKSNIPVSETVKSKDVPVASQSLPWFALGWAMAGFLAGFLYSSDFASEILAGIVGNTIGGAIGGFLITLSLRGIHIPAAQKNTFRTILAWAVAAAVGWTIGRYLTEASGAGLGMVVFPLIGLAGTWGMEYVLSNWKSTTVIALGWAISAAIGWVISRTILIDSMDVDIATSWGIGTAIGWAIGGVITIWQILKTWKI